MRELHVCDIANEAGDLPAVHVDLGDWTGSLLLHGCDPNVQVSDTFRQSVFKTTKNRKYIVESSLWKRWSSRGPPIPT